MDEHYYTSPNQQEEPPTISIEHSKALPDDALPFQLRGRIWALHNHPYLPFMLFSPFHGAMTSRLSTPPEEISLLEDGFGFHLPQDVSRSWKTLEQSCLQIITVLRDFFKTEHPKVFVICSDPPNPSQFGYSKCHRTKEKARHALSTSLDAFVLLFACVSFYIAICRGSGDPACISSSSSTSTHPRWFQRLSLRQSRIHPEWLQLLADSPISDFTSTPQRVGAILNVARCSWIDLVPYMLQANVPIWLYWGTSPNFLQPLNAGALRFAPRAHPQSRAPPLPVITPSQSVGLSTPSQSVGLPTLSQSVGLPTPSQSVPLRSQQLPGETWKDFLVRQDLRRKKKLSIENEKQRQAREDCENTAAKRSCPGKKGPTVYLWVNDNGVWNRTLLTRGEVERDWSGFLNSQMIYNSVDNCWDVCREFDAGTAGEVCEYDSNDSDNDTYYPPAKQSRRSPTPKNGRSDNGSACPPYVVESTPHSVLTPAHVSPDCTPMVIDTTPQITSDLPSESMLVDPTPAQTSSDSPPMLDDPTTAQIPSDLPMLVDPKDSVPLAQSVPTPAQVASPPPPILVDAHEPASLPLSMPPQQPNLQSGGDFIDSDDEVPEDPYEASRKDVLNAYSFVALDLEVMPVTTLDDLLYYRYGFSLRELPYTGVPSSITKATFRSWIEVCRSVGGQNFEEASESAANRDAIVDFLSILAQSDDPLKDVPGKFWDLSPQNPLAIVNLDKIFISIEERQFTNLKSKHYIIRPRFLHPSRDTPWLLSVDCMTALECIRRRLGPHSIDIANFLISHGVHFHTLQRIPDSPNSEESLVRPSIRFLGNRSADYSFDLADFAGYEVLRDSFLRSQSHGPLALREGGIVARLAREVLPNSNALSGPSPEALSGRRARFTYGTSNEIYVDDTFLEEELGLICGTYALGTPKELSDPKLKKRNEFSIFSSCY